MTKKSDARLVRDAAKKRDNKAFKENTGWDDLIGIKLDCYSLLEQHSLLSQLMKDDALRRLLPDPQAVVANYDLLIRDLGGLSEDLKKIGDLHAGRSGGSTTPEELIRTIEIYELYNLFLARHQAVVVPTTAHILEAFQVAEQRLNAAMAAAQAQSTEDTGPIDVVCRETTVVTQEPAKEAQ